jgi:hypothetical protein
MGAKKMRAEQLPGMFLVQCIEPSLGIIYSCNVSTWVEAFSTAHLLAEVYEHRANVFRPGEDTHCYQATGRPDITNRFFT